MASKLFDVLVENTYTEPERRHPCYCGLVSAYGLNQIIGMLSRRQEIPFVKYEFSTEYISCLGKLFIEIGKYRVLYRYVGDKYRIPEVKSHIYNNFFREVEE